MVLGLKVISVPASFQVKAPELKPIGEVIAKALWTDALSMGSEKRSVIEAVRSTPVAELLGRKPRAVGDVVSGAGPVVVNERVRVPVSVFPATSLPATVRV